MPDLGDDVAEMVFRLGREELLGLVNWAARRTGSAVSHAAARSAATVVKAPVRAAGRLLGKSGERSRPEQGEGCGKGEPEGPFTTSGQGRDIFLDRLQRLFRDFGVDEPDSRALARCTDDYMGSLAESIREKGLEADVVWSPDPDGGVHAVELKVRGPQSKVAEAYYAALSAHAPESAMQAVLVEERVARELSREGAAGGRSAFGLSRSAGRTVVVASGEQRQAARNALDAACAKVLGGECDQVEIPHDLETPLLGRLKGKGVEALCSKDLLSVPPRCFVTVRAGDAPVLEAVLRGLDAERKVWARRHLRAASERPSAPAPTTPPADSRPTPCVPAPERGR